MLQIVPTTTTKTNEDNIIYIDNSKYKSISSKYNFAIENYVLKRNDPIVCFRHDDVTIRTPLNICQYKLEKLFETHKVGIAGLIGTIALDKNSTWWNGVPSAGGRSTYGSGAIIQGGTREINKDNKVIKEPYEYWMDDHPGVHDYLATVDGCCIFFPKWIFEEGLRFDENLLDYHFYDCDISLQVLERGYKVSTIDIAVKHESEGVPPENFDKLREKFYLKWDKKVHNEWPISRLSIFYKE